MNITIAPEYEALVQDKVERGHYHNAEAVVEDALRLLDARDQVQHLKHLVALGIAQADRGETVPYTDELLAEIDRAATKKANDGHPLNPDVCP